MRKYTKYSVSAIIIILLLVLGYTTYAEENVNTIGGQIACTMDAKICPDGVTSVGRIPPNCEFAKCPGELGGGNGELRKEFGGIRDVMRENKEANQANREELKNQLGEMRNSLEVKREEHRVQMQGILEDIKAKREEFRLKFEGDKEAARAKMESMKATFKNDLSKIKDENKKLSAEKIVNGIQNLNTKLTDQLLAKTEQIENVLVSVESRIKRAEERGINVDLAKTEAGKAKIAIQNAKDAISAQVKKGETYTVNIKDEATLKTEMKRLRDTFNGDIKAVREKVKLAHMAVRNAAVELAKIPKIDDDSDEANQEVENTNTEDSN